MACIGWVTGVARYLNAYRIIMVSSTTEKNNREACKQTSLRCDVPQHTLTPYGAVANIVIYFKTVSQWTWRIISTCLLLSVYIKVCILFVGIR